MASKWWFTLANEDTHNNAEIDGHIQNGAKLVDLDEERHFHTEFSEEQQAFFSFRNLE